MSSIDMIVSLDDKLRLETDYFISQLKSRWPDVQIHFYNDDRFHSLLQWHVDADVSVLGDFDQNGISFQTHSDHDFAQVLRWFRKIVPAQYRLLYLVDSLNNAPFELLPDMTEEEIIKASHREYDDDEFQKFVDIWSGDTPTPC